MELKGCFLGVKLRSDVRYLGDRMGLWSVLKGKGAMVGIEAFGSRSGATWSSEDTPTFVYMVVDEFKFSRRVYIRSRGQW